MAPLVSTDFSARAVCAETGSVDALVTVGAGTQQLGALRQLKAWHTVVGWLVLLIYPSFVLLVLVWTLAEIVVALQATALTMLALSRMAFTGPSPEASALLDAATDLWMSLVWSPLTMVGLGLVALAAVALLVARRAAVPDELTVPRVRVWHDVSSVLDPVCPGGAVLESAAIATEVVNTDRPMHAFFEHTRYFANEQVAHVIALAIEATGVRHLVHRPLGTAPRRQRMLLSFGRWGWPITLLLSVGMLAVWGVAAKAVLGVV